MRLQENNCVQEREKEGGSNGSEQGARVHRKRMRELTQNGQQEAVNENTQPTESSTSANESQYGPVPSGGDDWV